MKESKLKKLYPDMWESVEREALDVIMAAVRNKVIVRGENASNKDSEDIYTLAHDIAFKSINAYQASLLKE